MSKYVELPSGRMLDTEDIIYVGLVEDKLGLFGRGYFFKVSWASRITYTLQYRDYNECSTDREFIIDTLLKHDAHTPGENMVCS